MDDRSSIGSGSSDDGSTSCGSRKRSVYSTNHTPHRSVVDYDTEEQLREAMLSFLNDVDGESNGSCSAQLSALLSDIRDGQPVQKVLRSSELQTELSNGYDWVLPKYDEELSHPQTVQDEMQRLQVLKSYLIVDSKREAAFDRITQLASRIFDVPVAMVTLVDLGRQFFMSTYGFEKYGISDDLRDVPRDFALCSHAILNKDKILVVPDLTKDFRFVENPFVKGPPYAKFYAGAPLVTPEGYKIGTVCMLDTVARPNGLSEEECSTLADLADMTMKVMVDRRYQLNKKTESPSQVMAYTAHDMMAPLTSVHLSLSILNSDASIRGALGEHQLELLNTAASCSELMMRICKSMVGDLGQREKPSPVVATTKTTVPATSSSNMESNIPLTNLNDLVRNLKMTVDPIPKKVPCIVTLDKEVPNTIVGDDLKLFRCAVNLLTNAIDRTTTGKVHLTIRWDGDTLLLFECEDTGLDVPVEEYQYLFQRENNSDKLLVGLSSIAQMMDSMDGEYGFRPKNIDSAGNTITDSRGQRRTGSIFWFSIPLQLPEILDNTSDALPLHPQSQGTFNLEPIPVAVGQTTSQQQPIQYPSTGSVHAIQRSQYAGTSNHDSIYNQQRPTDINFSLAQGNAPSSDANVLDELGKLALDLNASLTDFEPYPVTTGGFKPNTNDVRRKRRALVIDDSVVVRRNLAVALNQLGFDVTHASDGNEGLRQLQKMLYDIVFCEFNLPYMDGLACVSQYRNWEKINRSWDSQLIIGISANPTINNNGQGSHAGMNAFLPKPITLKTLSGLDCSTEVVQRTHQLDEWEGTTSSSYVDTSRIIQETNIPRSMSSSQSQLAPIPNTTVATTTTTTTTPFSCLIATDMVIAQSNSLAQQLESMGWTVVVVDDGIDCLELLKMQKWATILIEDNLTQLSGQQCVSAFRKWEEIHGVNVADRQMNVYYVCDIDIPSPTDGNSWIQPPVGYNGVLRKPVPWDDLRRMLMRNHQSR